MKIEIPNVVVCDIIKNDYIKELADIERQISAYKNIVRNGISNTIKN